MRHGWETKKLGEVCKLFTDGDWIESKDQSNKGIRLIQTGNIGCGEFNDKADHYRYISEETFIRLNCTEIYAGDILISRLPDPIGRSCIIPRMPHRMITAVDCTIVRPKNIINPNFLVYYTNSRQYQDEINRYVTGAVRKRISRKNLFKIPIPIPPLSEQERIVAELDLLSDVIAKKREQLKQLDTLAQSIFYDMFGDPITNEKGWKQVSLVDICKNTGVYGAGSSSMPKQLYRPRYVRITDILDSGDLNDDFVVSSNVEDDETYRLNVGDILFARSGATVGKTYLYRGNEAQIYAGYLIKFSLNILYVNPIFIFYITKNRSYKLWISKQIIGVAQPNINAQKYGKLPIILPPLALQQQFASMIESIEKQKELIKQSLSEVQQLFDSRMDYYFG